MVLRFGFEPRFDDVILARVEFCKIGPAQGKSVKAPTRGVLRESPKKEKPVGGGPSGILW